ncbi:cyclin-dependent kinase inhibitor 7-like [Impatiens glandulifera]|uniref:cyclin-dependent kinase inhibitor 7-like n=1 Tax=Impatiens glandulifera TaxID=253017 RepID=UPI001FB1076B|nr:cyclin-dependent kinase inhibitor 7-like [Impatiens glandulifera]
MEVACGVGIKKKKRRTRGESTHETSSETVKRNKLMTNDGGRELTPSSPPPPPTSIIQLRRSTGGRGGDIMTTRSENSTSPCLDEPPTVSHNTSDHVVAISCCSSNSSTEFGNDGLQNLDLHQFKSDDETVHIQISTSEFNCCREKSISEVEEVESASQDDSTKKPSEIELEEFFSSAEKRIQEQFIQKYNYDIAKDSPLKGRYEWIQMKP